MSLTDRLLNGVNIQFGKSGKSGNGIVHGESTVGIDTDFESVCIKVAAYMLHHIEFFDEIDSTDFEFNALESLADFLLNALNHFVETTHPHKSVDCDRLSCSREV